MFIKLKNLVWLFLVFLIIAILALSVINTKKNLDTKSNQIEFLEKNLNKKKSQIKNVHEKLIFNNIHLEEIIFSNGINFKHKSNLDIEYNTNNYTLSEFSSDDIVFAKHPAASSSAYIDTYEENLFLVTATGQIAFSNLNNLFSEKIEMISIKSNIKNIINYAEFYKSSPFGIKDILVNENKIYISYIKEVNSECYNTSILVGKIDYNNINFSEFFSEEDCINKNDPFFKINKNDKLVPHQAGGRMIAVNDKIMLTVGEYRKRVLAQNENSYFGKIISINKNSKKYKMISKGHRNPQGLYFNNQINKLFSTEHGPYGGDEINVIDLSNTNATPNYGWPIASYGDHYYQEKDDSRLDLSPLEKSHEKNGFIEPIKYFVPSVGISEITEIPKKFTNSNNPQFIVGTMGTAKKIKDGMLSLYFFEYDNFNNKIKNEKLIPIKSRVRDIKYLSQHNSVVLFLETNSTLGILKQKN